MKQIMIVALMLLPACSEKPAESISVADAAKAHVYIAQGRGPAARPERFNPAAIDAAIASFQAEAKVRGVQFDPTNTVEWHIAVDDDSSKRYGLAGYFCLRLRELGVYDDNVDVRIIDASRIAEFKDAYREYSLGGVQCKDEAQIW